MAEKSGKGTPQAYEAEAEAMRAKTERLRALRLAREAQRAQPRHLGAHRLRLGLVGLRGAL